MEWKVAPSYANAKIVSINEDTHKAYIEEKCPRCGGLGIIVSRIENNQPIPVPVDGGICYKCHGEKVIYRWVKAYTENEYDKYIASQKKAKERKERAAEAHKQALIDNSEINKKELLAKWGYDPELPLIWLVTGENTYAIKDTLKELGCKFNPTLGWYSSHPIDVPEYYGMVSIPFDNIYDWNCFSKRFDIKDNAKEVAEAALNADRPKSLSEYIGDIKERIRDIEVVLTNIRQFDGYYGMCTIYTFDFNNNVLVWITSSEKDFSIGEKLILTGTVKKHNEYKGVKQTELSRCILKHLN